MELRPSQCLIGIDCSSLINLYHDGLCPNKTYCSYIAKAWNLPYVYSCLEDGTRFLKVKFNFTDLPSSQSKDVKTELINSGFAQAVRLPYLTVIADNGSKALVVHDPSYDAQKLGWVIAFDLPEEYHQWQVAKQTNNYKDYFPRLQSTLYDDHWLYELKRYYPLVDVECLENDIDDISF